MAISRQLTFEVKAPVCQKQAADVNSHHFLATPGCIPAAKVFVQGASPSKYTKDLIESTVQFKLLLTSPVM